jgi:hypothetical protein
MSIPSEVANIGDDCFRGCGTMTAISFHSSEKLTHIQARTFYMAGLVSIAIPSSVEVLGRRCVADCLMLLSVTFPGDSKLLCIQGSLFSGCWSLGPISLPSSIERVSRGAFSGCVATTQLAFGSPFRIRELLDLPPDLVGCVGIPDSVETVTVPTEWGRKAAAVLHFGPESKLRNIRTYAKRAFLQVASRTLKTARSNFEFDKSSLYRG